MFLKFLSVTVRTLLHIQERLKVEHSLQDVIFKAAIKGSPPVQSERYRFLKMKYFFVCITI